MWKTIPQSFNNTIGKAREMAFVPMLEIIRRLAMARIAKRSAISHAHKGILTPYATEFITLEKKKANECTITRSTNGMYKAKVAGCTHCVGLDRYTCTCMKFEICGIPCEHAYGVILHKKLKAEDFVCKWFRTAMWRRNYVDGLIPVRGARFWPETGAPDVLIPSDPDQPGRKKMTKADKKRNKPANESPTKKQPKHKKRIMPCGLCGQPNHNSRFDSKKKPSGAGSSQIASPAASQTPSQAPSQDMC